MLIEKDMIRLQEQSRTMQIMSICCPYILSMNTKAFAANWEFQGQDTPIADSKSFRPCLSLCG